LINKTKYLIIDAGNTSTKCVLVVNGELQEVKRFTSLTLWKKHIKELEYQACIISSVASKKATEFMVDNTNSAILFSSKTPIPISNGYKTPETLGYDRLANVIAANALYPNQNSLVIDAGTCLKFDFINDNKQYLGGAISPGLSMRFKALHTFTANLPLIEQIESQHLIGKNTTESMISGCLNGMVAEIDNVIEQYRNLYSNLNVILTGGDAEMVEKSGFKQKNSIFANHWLTLNGLNEILQYNVRS
jgi:type III pantothenate kinase